MFGYVNVFQDELKIKEFKVFKAYYCGLCKEQGKLLGNITRLALSYDFTVLALILDSLCDEPTPICVGTCMLHPFKKRPVTQSSVALSYSAYMSVALTYFKIKDDITDSTVSKSVVALPFFAAPMKKIRSKYPDKVSELESHLKNIRKFELENCKNIDLPASEFGKLMAELFCYNKENERILYQLGFNLGRWLYIVDAIDDFNSDIKKNRYNPFENKEQIKNSLDSLWYNLSEVGTSYELLSIKRNKQLTDNIIYYGIKNSTQLALDNLNNEKKQAN